MEMNQTGAASQKVAELYADLARRSGSSPFGSCPVELTAAFLRMCLAQSCGKCVPCRVGLDKLGEMLEKVLSGEAPEGGLDEIAALARSVYDSSDCAIGFEAAKLVLDGLAAFGDDYASHVEKGMCTASFAPVPCSKGCPAHVDIPAYVALAGAGRFADAVRVIRRDNPFPSACGLVCEHPCEKYCRRNVVDDAINIRGIKRFAVERAGKVPVPQGAPKNGKTVGIIGGGPAGLTAAYFLALRGFDVTVVERRTRLGGMLRYGIPSYRLPDADLDLDIDAILSTGVKTEFGVEIGRDTSFADFRSRFDAVYVSIGAHGAKRLRIEGEDAKGVISAVELLGAAGEGRAPDFTGLRVAVVGGGNVAMDAVRTSRRLGAKSVVCVYRRRIADMTALPEEIAGAEAEGCEIMQLAAPVRVAVEGDRAVGLVVKPQMAGPVKNGRPAPVDSSEPETTVPCDVLVVAIGQDILSAPFAEAGLPVKRGAFDTPPDGVAAPGVFVGGDCWSGPATVIRAIDAGKTAAENIAEFLCGKGGAPLPEEKIEIPAAGPFQRLHWGRVNMRERPASERACDFGLMEKGLTDEEAKQECGRCLRCDRFGYGAFRGGRAAK